MGRVSESGQNISVLLVNHLTLAGTTLWEVTMSVSEVAKE